MLLAWIVFASTMPASAFCRKTTSGGDLAYDPSQTGTCTSASRSLPLFWPRGCIEVRVSVDAALEAEGKMDGARAKELVRAAIDAWTGAACGGDAGAKTPAIAVLDVSDARCPGASGAAGNEIVFSATPTSGDGVLAQTDVTFDTRSGAIASAHLSILDIYGDVAGTSAAERDANVGYVVRHEMGHFLGLAHSQRTDAVMYASYDTTRIAGLAPDDVAGICDAYGPDAPIGAGCGIAPRASWSAGALLGSVALALLLARRARRRGVRLVVPALLIAASVALAPDARAAPTDGATARPAAKRRAPKRPVRKKRPPGPRVTPSDERPIRHEEERVPAAPVKVSPAASASGTPAPATLDVTPARPPAESAVTAPPAPRASDLFLGARYRAFAMPKILIGAFARGGDNLLWHSVGVEGDIRKGRLSIVPALSFADFSTGQVLLGARSSDRVASFSMVKSELKALAGSVALAWVFPLGRSVDVELGVELGVAVTFGSLIDNWVYEASDGPLAYGGRRFAPCRTVNDGVGCRPQDHASPIPVRVGNYREPSVFEGGRAPTLLPWVSLPLAGVRFAIGRDVAARVGIGASLTGIWAGASLDYLVARRQTP